MYRSCELLYEPMRRDRRLDDDPTLSARALAQKHEASRNTLTLIHTGTNFYAQGHRDGTQTNRRR